MLRRCSLHPCGGVWMKLFIHRDNVQQTCMFAEGSRCTALKGNPYMIQRLDVGRRAALQSWSEIYVGVCMCVCRCALLPVLYILRDTGETFCHLRGKLKRRKLNNETSIQPLLSPGFYAPLIVFRVTLAKPPAPPN